jgi:ribosome recycling factor
MDDSKSKKLTNTKKEYDDAIVSEDPTKISESDLEKLAKEAIKKFKSLG